MLKLWKKASLPVLSEKPEAEKEDRQHTRSSQNHHQPPSFLFSPEVPYTWLLHWEHATRFEIMEIRGKIGQNLQARARCCAGVLTASSSFMQRLYPPEGEGRCCASPTNRTAHPLRSQRQCLNRLPQFQRNVPAPGSWLTPRFNKGLGDNKTLSGTEFWGSARCDTGSGGGIKLDNLLTALPGALQEFQGEWFTSGHNHLKKYFLKAELADLSHPTFQRQI